MAAVSAATARRRVPDTSSRCVVDSVTGTHDFKVANYSLLAGHVGLGKHVSSTTFAVGGHDWGIEFFPDGFTGDGLPSSTSVYLYLYSRPVPAGGLIAKFTLRLVDRNGKESFVGRCKAVTKTFDDKSNVWGWECFFWKPFLSLSRCLVNDCLTIRCVLTILTPLPAEEYTAPVELPPPELPGHLERALKNGRGADVTFDVGGTEFSANRFMLAARSPVFEAELFGPVMEKYMELIKIV